MSTLENRHHNSDSNIPDRNKTELTCKVTAAAYNWLDERGFKPVETEVSIADGWVADLAGVVSPTLTELQDLKLIKRRPKWNQLGYKEWWAQAKEFQRQTGVITAIVEVKTSLSDFRSDSKWGKPAPAQLAYLAIPQDLPVNMNEWPVGWGLLLYSPVSGCVRIAASPTLHEIALEQKFRIVHEIAVRRDHHTRYERHRALRKELAATRNEDISLTRMSKALRGMRSVVRGEHGSAEKALEYHGIKKHIYESYLVEIEKLFGIAPRNQRDEHSQ